MSPREFILQFYREVVVGKWDISEEQCLDICRTPFAFLRKCMQSDYLFEVRFIYFGVFRVKPGRVKEAIRGLDKAFSEGKIEEENYQNIRKKLTNFIERNEYHNKKENKETKIKRINPIIPEFLRKYKKHVKE